MPAKRSSRLNSDFEAASQPTAILSQLFESYFHALPTRVEPLQGQLGGSGRNIVRLANDEHKAIGIVYGVREENAAFLEFSKTFRRHGLPVPQIYAEDLDHGAYLEEDLGDLTLFQFLSGNRLGEDIAPEVIEAYRKVVAILPRFQVEMRHKVNYKVCYPRASFDRQSIAWDLNYFKYYFLRLAGIPFNEQALENDFAALTKFLLEADHNYFLYRDFQSRNVMLVDGSPYFLDYQGGRKGALQYDIASLLYDAKADLPQGLKYSDQSIQIEERYDNLMTKSKILAAMGKADEAQKFSAMALQKADAAQSYQYARQLQRDHKQDAAFAIYREMARKYPTSLFTYAGQARIAVGAGNYDEAVKQMKLAQAAAPDNAKSQIQGLINRLEKKEDINK